MTPGERRVDVTCPFCQHGVAECLENLSAVTDRDYLRCEKCGHIWTVIRAPVEPPCDLPEHKD